MPKSFPEEFRADVIAVARQGDQSVAQVAWFHRRDSASGDAVRAFDSVHCSTVPWLITRTAAAPVTGPAPTWRTASSSDALSAGWLPAHICARAAAERRASGETARERDPSALTTLTPMERQVAQLVSQGFPDKDVAAKCWISARTVEFHLRNAFAKTGVTSRGALAGLGPF